MSLKTIHNKMSQLKLLVSNRTIPREVINFSNIEWQDTQSNTAFDS